MPAIGRHGNPLCEIWPSTETFAKTTSSPQVEPLLESCDRSSRIGARDFAILMLLARLGLRAVEVSRLALDDVHWGAGEIEVDGNGHERDRLPLPSNVGEALVEHLKRRGHSAHRRVFLTVHAPTRPIEASG